ncbi:MAG TPA: hypothetical protein VF824_12725 [Thermoanaerobaculia bacterium]|jgi:hypothetical protein
MRILKLVLVVAVLVVGFKVLEPRLRGVTGAKDRVAAIAGRSSSCPDAAAKASETWGNGIGRFINPPYDTEAWSRFRDSVDTKIRIAESACTCGDEPCRQSREAMSSLRGLVSDLDATIRNGAELPGDVVQRQEAIDNQIEAARNSANSATN